MNPEEFRIRFAGEFYSGTLYDERGRYVYTLEEAIETAQAQYPDARYEVYNGTDGWDNFEE